MAPQHGYRQTSYGPVQIHTEEYPRMYILCHKDVDQYQKQLGLHPGSAQLRIYYRVAVDLLMLRSW
jgi:hypothetical protein